MASSTTILAPARREAAVPATRVVDALLFAAVFTITFAKLRWGAGSVDVNISDITAALFLVAFLGSRADRHDGRLTRSVGVLLAFFGLFLAVYLAGFFNLGTVADRDLWIKGLVKFAIHFAFLIAAVAHIAQRGASFYWRTLGWFVAGMVANAVYGVFQLAIARSGGGNLDEIFLSPIGSYEKGGINVYGAVNGENVYRTNALTLDPNHLSIMLIVPLLVLLPIYLRLERGHRLRTPLALVLAFLAIVDLSTLSRSGILGLVVGLVVLALPYRRFAVSARFLVPLALVALVVGVVVAQRTGFFETVFRSRTSLSGGSVNVHLGIYDLVPPVIHQHPLFGLGVNTFSSYYEFVTGKSNWGPHSYYVALLAETGILGALAFLAYLVYLFRRLALLHRIGRALAAAGDALAVRVRPLAWGLTAALLGTLVANVFYLTMQMYYFFVLAIFVVAAPIVFSRSREDRV